MPNDKNRYFSGLNLEEITKRHTVHHFSDVGGGGCPSSRDPHSMTKADWQH